jgi:hypothetical protein
MIWRLIEWASRRVNPRAWRELDEARLMRAMDHVVQDELRRLLAEPQEVYDQEAE